MTTPHLSAAEGAFAPTVLMPGDPKRAARIAEVFLSDAKAVSDVRGMVGYTGTYNGVAVSAMPSGMGVPSAAIYITELVRFYGVNRIIRVGTAGAYQPNIGLRQIIAATTAETDSNLPSVIGATAPYAASPSMLEAAQRAASASGIELMTGPIFTSDAFYEPSMAGHDANTAKGLLCVEMETAGLYAIAALEGFEALALMTVTDHLALKQELTADERQNTVDEMLKLALDTATISQR